MTPPAAATAPRSRTKRATPPPRRVSGHVRGRAASTAAGPPPLALRLGGAVHGLAEHRWLDRVIRGRAWIGILAVGLIGIVFMQVSMLRLNTGIGRAVDEAGTLERENSALRASISQLSANDRLEAEAAKLGLVVPIATPRFLDARGARADRAAASITRPGDVPDGFAPTTAPSVTAPALASTTVPPAAGTTTTTTATATPPSSTTATAPASTQAAATPPATTTTPATATTPTTTAQAPTQQSPPATTASPPSEQTGGASATGTGG